MDGLTGYGLTSGLHGGVGGRIATSDKLLLLWLTACDGCWLASTDRYTLAAAATSHGTFTYCVRKRAKFRFCATVTQTGAVYQIVQFLPREQQCKRGISCRNYVCPSVCHTLALWQNQTMHCGYFDTTRKGTHRSFLTPTVVGGRRPLPSKICAQGDPRHTL